MSYQSTGLNVMSEPLSSNPASARANIIPPQPVQSDAIVTDEIEASANVINVDEPSIEANDEALEINAITSDAEEKSEPENAETKKEMSEQSHAESRAKIRSVAEFNALFERRRRGK